MSHSNSVLSSASIASTLRAIDLGSMQSSLDGFRALRVLLEGTRHHVWQPQALDAHIRKVEDTLFALDDHGIATSLFLDALPAPLITLQQLAYCRWEVWLEQQFAQGLRSHSSIDDYRLVTRFRRLIQRETELLGAKPVTRALFIGSGPMPVSAILLHERTGAQVDCVDMDGSAVVQSRRVIAHLGLEANMRVLHADGSGIDASSYDAVLIALLAKPKAEILRHLSAAAREDCRVVCRTATGLRVLVYEPLERDLDLSTHVVEAQKLATAADDTISSLLLKVRTCF